MRINPAIVALLWLVELGFAHPLRAERVVLVAGGEQPVSAIAATQSKLISPFGLDFDRAGHMFIVEISGHRVLKVDSAGMLTKIGGTGEKGDKGDGGPALQAEFNGMHSLAVAPSGDIYIADTWNNRVRKIDARTGAISSIAGTGEKGFSGDGGPASAAMCGGIYCVALDTSGERLYLADLDDWRIRNGGPAHRNHLDGRREWRSRRAADGAVANQAPLVDPRAVAIDSQGTVYVLERSGHALRAVDREGKIRTVAGTGQAGLEGDGGDAKAAKLRGPKHICCDREDNVLVADTDNHVVRKYFTRTGKIVRVAGTGEKGSAGIGGPAEQLQMNQPHGVHVDKSGIIYIVDSKNHRVLKLVE